MYEQLCMLAGVSATVEGRGDVIAEHNDRRLLMRVLVGQSTDKPFESKVLGGRFPALVWQNVVYRRNSTSTNS